MCTNLRTLSVEFASVILYAVTLQAQIPDSYVPIGQSYYDRQRSSFGFLIRFSGKGIAGAAVGSPLGSKGLPSEYEASTSRH